MCEDNIDDKNNKIPAGLGPGRHIVIVPEGNRELLSRKQLRNYYFYRNRFLEWLLHRGKNPDKDTGYSPYTVYESGYRTAAFDRWIWDYNDGTQVPPSHEDANAYLENINHTYESESTKGKIQEALQRYFRWVSHEYGHDEWEPEFKFDSSGSEKPNDFLTMDEANKIRRVSKGWGLSQKITSLVWTSLDAALRPVEVQRAKIQWVDVSNSILRIPKEESSKNEEKWMVSLTNETATVLEQWLKERKNTDRYNDTDLLWLTTHDNPYGSKSLARLLHRLCDEAGIRTDNRQISWYMIRNYVGTYMTREEDLAATKEQLRHKSKQTTMAYDGVPIEDRRDALNRMR